VPKAGRFFDYEEKYSASGADEHCPPITIGAATCARVQEIGLRAFRAAGCEGYARVDFMIPRARGTADGEPIVLEINTLPGMTARSLLPRAAAEAGIGYRELCLEILRLAVERRTT
jgi:D-alanine-D-alanine ligase